MTEPNKAGETEAAPVQPVVRSWFIKLNATSDVFETRALTTLQQWIVEKRVTAEDLISHDGEVWKPLGGIVDLEVFFEVAERPRRPLARIVEPTQKIVPLKRSPRRAPRKSSRGSVFLMVGALAAVFAAAFVPEAVLQATLSDDTGVILAPVNSAPVNSAGPSENRALPTEVSPPERVIDEPAMQGIDQSHKRKRSEAKRDERRKLLLVQKSAAVTQPVSAESSDDAPTIDSDPSPEKRR